MKYDRRLKDRLLRSLQTSPVTLLVGPRQSGKTTLMRAIGENLGMGYLTFDSLKQLAAAQEDPEGFIELLQKPIIIDEVQRAPEIALPIKLVVDQSRRAGLFGLTGSANPLVAPKLNDSLAGRMFILHMWPLSMGEILGKKSNFLELAFDPEAAFTNEVAWGRNEMVEAFTAGGYPDSLLLDSQMRYAWHDNLLTTILERDVQNIAHIAKPRELSKLLSILSTRTSNLLNAAELSRISGIPYTTLNHYLFLLEALFLIIRLPAWHINRVKRLVKMPKVYFGDTGILINQLKADPKSILTDGRLLGPILENFAYLELKKLTTWSDEPIEMYHYRTQTGSEVDLVLENRSGQIIGIEIKATETISADDWKGLNVLASEMGDKMVKGIILYPGKEIVALGKNRIALPITSLWEC